MAANPEDTKWAETGIHKVDIKEEPHESGVGQADIHATKRPSLEDFMSAINIIKKERKSNVNHVSSGIDFSSDATIRPEASNKLNETSSPANSICQVTNPFEKKVSEKSKEESKIVDAATSLVVLAMHQSLNIESLGYSVIENDASERDNYISKDDLTRLADVPEKYSSVGVGHQITNRDSDSDSSDAEHSPEDEEYRLKCKVCRKMFENEHQLDMHVRIPQTAKVYKCCACGKIFRDNSQLNVHTRTHTGEQPYECKECGKRFSINGNLSKHMRLHTGERRFQCDLCEKKFTQFAHLEDHVKTHSGDKPYQCDVCLSAFKTKARLKKHVKCHQEERVTKRSVRCPVCDRVLKTMRQLIDHVKSHGDNDEPYHCVVCGKTYRTLFYLQSHQKLHNGIRAFQCNLCDKAFTTSSQLRRHVNSHAGIKPFTCELCDKAFPSTQNLKRHILTHTGIKPYSCDVCSKGFLTLENLNRHMRTHTGEKPYSCDLCGKKFAHSTTVKEHRHTHTGDKPYGCSVCGRRFTASKLLFKHIRQRHPEYNDHFERINSMPPNTLMRRTALAQMQQEYFQMMAVQERELQRHQTPTGCYISDETEGAAVKTEPVDTDAEEDDEGDDEGEEEDGAESSGGEEDAGVACELREVDEPLEGIGMVSVKEEKEDAPGDCDSPSLKCDICEKTFTSPKRLDRHRLIHNKSHTQKYKCTICSKTLATLDSLTRHTEGHKLRGDPVYNNNQKCTINSRSGRSFKCGMCAKEFTSERRAGNHIVLKHAGKGEIIKTTASNKIKPSAKTKTKESPPTPVTVNVENIKDETTGDNCDNSGNVLPDLASLTPYPCEVCFRNFASPEVLQDHKKVHGDDKPFTCDLCGECFTHGVTLNEHRWVHTGDTPFQCSFCSEHFVSTRLLQDHLRTQHLMQYEFFKIKKPGQYKAGEAERENLHVDARSELAGGFLGQGIKVEAGDGSC